MLIQFFVCFGNKNKGCDVTKKLMSHWMIEAISLAYEVRGLASSLGVRAHTPISRSRHFEIESEAGGKKPGSIAFNHRSSGHIVVFQAVHPINEKSVIKSCHFIAFRLLL